MKKAELVEIKLEEITLATNDFHDTNCIGRGGFGKVYKGALPQFKERMVAFKRLDRIHGQGNAEYLKEIAMLSSYVHENLISLLGFCNQGKEMILVYEYASRGSLDRHLNSVDLTWKQRLNICIAAAKGLNYLHDPRETSQRLIHCDIKSANILLDDEWNAKVADFGLAKIAPVNQHNSTLITNPSGTPGYCDPLFIETYKLTKESDVYSFGVVLFEVLCGRPCCVYGSNGQLNKVFVSKWISSYKERKLDEIIFKDLGQPMDPKCLEIYSGIAFECLKRNRQERPTMSVVVEQLEMALKCLQLKPPQEYEDIVNAAVPPLAYESLEELKVLLSQGFLVDDGKTWFSLNDHGEHYILRSIKDDNLQFSHEYNSRFTMGTCSTSGSGFKTFVTSTYLSRGITYTMNLMFKCPQMFQNELGKQRYISVTYKFEEGERRISIVYIGDKRQDEWLRAKLLQFTTSDNATIGDMGIDFYPHENSLEVEGIEFQPVPMKIDVDLEQDDDELGDDHQKYEEIVKSAEPSFLYTSLHQLKVLLSKGVLLNSGNTWFYLDDNGQHCEMISIKECLIQDAKEHCPYSSEYNSRFIVGACFALDFTFKIRVRGQFLTPLITYTVNLVFKFYNGMNLEKGPNIFLKYKLQGQAKSSISYLADKREDDWWMIELCHFTNQGPTTDLEIIFEDNHPYIVVEGIEFLPMKLEKEEHQVLEDENVDDQQPLSVAENGKKCLTLSPLAAINGYDLKWQSLPEPRFEGMVELLHFEIVSKINPKLLSLETRYATYLVYKLPQDQSKFETLVKVMDGKGLVSNDNWGKADSWNVILVSPQIPVNVTREFDEITSNPLKRSKIKGIPQHRSDGSMEVQVWEFHTDTTTEFIPMRLRLKMYNKWFDGLSIQGIEFRPISI